MSNDVVDYKFTKIVAATMGHTWSGWPFALAQTLRSILYLFLLVPISLISPPTVTFYFCKLLVGAKGVAAKVSAK